MKKQDSSAELHVMARAPFHKYYEGTAKSVSAANGVGKFDILPGHADFFSVMTPGEVVIETGVDTVNFAINNGVISVKDSEVKIFVNM
jgi:F0F1-type ATP synthase epsilon subunit